MAAEISQITAGHQLVVRLGNAQGLDDPLGEALVHARGRCSHAAAHIGQPGQLAEALDGAVLAVQAVQHGEDQVHLDLGERAALVDHDALLRGVGREDGAGAVLHPAVGLQLIQLLHQDPVSLLGDAHQQQVIAAPVNLLRNICRGKARNLVLRGLAAEQQRNRLFCHCIIPSLSQGPPAQVISVLL